MEKLTLADIILPDAYEPRRDEIRRRTVEHKRMRRVTVGPVLSFVFEDRETLRFQVMEMCRAEKIMDPAKVQAELDVYNSLVPGPRELSATMFIELTSEEELREWLPKLPGVEQSIALRVGDQTARAVGEEGRSKEDVTSSVHYLRFPLSEAVVAVLRSGVGQVHLVVDHPHYLASAELSPDTRASLARDLQA